jgi:hypothetical protein
MRGINYYPNLKTDKKPMNDRRMKGGNSILKIGALSELPFPTTAVRNCAVFRIIGWDTDGWI